MKNTNELFDSNIINLMNILSFTIGVINLELNQKQLSNEELDNHLQNQDKVLNEQTEYYLKTIIQQNNKIIELLERKI